MGRPVSRYRLHSSAFERTDETKKVNPKRMIILSVEGDNTERNYFQNLNRHLDDALIQIEILRHRSGDGYCDPTHVIELLEEYLQVRQGGIIPPDLPPEFTQKYSPDFIQAFLDGDGSLPSEQRQDFQDDLMAIGINLEYRRYLQTFGQEGDYFAVVLDRDCGNHSKKLMEQCSRHCEEQGYGFFLTNPCFEFWLLLHLCHVKEIFSPTELARLEENPRVSAHHTLVSQEVSSRAHHAKYISSAKFDQCYLPNIQRAISQAGQFATSFPELLEHMGSNLPVLFEILGWKPERGI